MSGTGDRPAAGAVAARVAVHPALAEAWWSLGRGALPRRVAAARFRELVATWIPAARREGYEMPAVAVLESGVLAYESDATLQALAEQVAERARKLADEGADGEDWMPHVAFVRLARHASSDPTWMLVRREAARLAARDPASAARMRTRLMLSLLRDSDVATRSGRPVDPEPGVTGVPDPWEEGPDEEIPAEAGSASAEALDAAAGAWETAHPLRAARSRRVHDHWTSHWVAHGRGGRPYSIEPGDLLEILNAPDAAEPRDGADPFAYVPCLALRADIEGSTRSDLRKILAERMRRLATASGGRRAECGALRSIEPIRVRERFERVLASEFALPAAWRTLAMADGRLLGYRRDFQVRELHPLEVVVASVPAEAAAHGGDPARTDVSARGVRHDVARSEARAAERALAVVLAETMEELLDRTSRSRVRLRWLEVEGDGRHPAGPRIARSALLAPDCDPVGAAPPWQRRRAWLAVFRRADVDPPADPGSAAALVHSHLRRAAPGRRVVVAVGACPVERDRVDGRTVACRAWYDTRGARPGFRAFVATGRRSVTGVESRGLSTFEAHELLAEAAAAAIADGLESS